ncbi:hypothetical protein BX286_6881 [Streptomyces sp. 3211.6]|uniref:hypothetical protein n=1 Tax=Streptomyces sp. 3211.6 TaxID=1938845 RepID=UPI000F2DCB14|nr:hypothetical protein [Streptomyces sp. 3211.6]RKS97071.1 hypothetical protein BX286_6881 [Streptomyces sp. 3211.6]
MAATSRPARLRHRPVAPLPSGGGRAPYPEQAAALALALAENEGEMRAVIGDALAGYSNGGGYGGFPGDDFE